jgi:AcrR family transcriptional regulator
LPQKTSTRQLILEAALDCIEEEGLDKLTIRKIARKAGTNVAAINYHFRSKDHLVAEVFSMTIRHMLEDVFAAMEDPAAQFDAVLTDVLFYLLDGSLRFPGITKAHLLRALDDPGRKTVSGRGLARVFDGLVDRAAAAYPSRTRAALRLRISQVLAGVMFTILNPDFFDLESKYRLTSSKHARALAEEYAKFFFCVI